MRFIFALIILGACATQDEARPPELAFLNHSYAVLDQQTADAIEQSEYLRNFAAVRVRTTHADGGESWTGRYVAGRQTYLEFFGPGDGGGDLGATGIAISPDKSGGLTALTARIIQAGVANPETEQKSRRYGDDEIPWFSVVAPPGEGDALSIWAMEYLPSFMNDPRSEKEAAEGPDDVISRERYLSDEYQTRSLRDVSAIEIATTENDIEMARPMFAAAGFSITETPGHLVARGTEMTISLLAVAHSHVGIRRIDFILNAPASHHVEQIGRSTLTVGPGANATWIFLPRS